MTIDQLAILAAIVSCLLFFGWWFCSGHSKIRNFFLALGGSLFVSAVVGYDQLLLWFPPLNAILHVGLVFAITLQVVLIMASSGRQPLTENAQPGVAMGLNGTCQSCGQFGSMRKYHGRGKYQHQIVCLCNECASRQRAKPL